MDKRAAIKELGEKIYVDVYKCDVGRVATIAYDFFEEKIIELKDDAWSEKLLRKAAEDEIKQLQAENARLREALEDIANRIALDDITDSEIMKIANDLTP